MGINLGRLGAVMARGRGAYQQGRVKREQMDFDNQRELNREQLNEAFRRDQLDARREQAAGMTQVRQDQLAQQAAQAEANRQAAAERQAAALETRRELASNTEIMRRELAQQGQDGRENLARITAALWRRNGRAPDDGDVRAARTENRQAETDYNQMLARRPRQSQFRDPLSGMADTEAFEDARSGFVADSIEKAGVREDARRRLSPLEGVNQPEPKDNRAAAIGELDQLKRELEEAIDAQPARKDEFLRQYADEVNAINARYGIRR